MPSHPNSQCICGHDLDEHSQVSYHGDGAELCDYSNCDCQGFTAAPPVTISDATEAQLRRLTAAALKRAAQDVRDASAELTLIQQSPLRAQAILALGEVAETASLNLDATTQLLDIIINALTSQETPYESH